MSFILDALRKSENERQRQGGPGLAEVAVSAPKTKTSVWATAAVVLLLANLVAVGVLMLRRARAPDEDVAQHGSGRGQPDHCRPRLSFAVDGVLEHVQAEADRGPCAEPDSRAEQGDAGDRAPGLPL